MLINITIFLILLNILAMFILTKIKFLNKDIFRFILTGGLNTFDYYLVYLILFQSIELNYLTSHITAFLTSAFISFFVTTKYTFKESISLKKFIMFPLTFLPNLLISTFFTIFLVNFDILSKTYASLIAMFLAIPVTFLVSKKIIKQ